MSLLQNVPEVVTAIGGLGTAAAGLVDATKVFGGGVNHIGLGAIQRRVRSLMPSPTKSTNALTASNALETIKANWFNGTDLGSQKAIAKSLIKLHLSPDNAAELAGITNVNAAMLLRVANKIAPKDPPENSPVDPSGNLSLTAEESDAYARFDMILTALLDETYTRSDQKYRNGTRAWAVLASVLLAFVGGLTLDKGDILSQTTIESLIVGLLATPLAPIAKDLSTALAAAVNALQVAKK